MVSVLPSSSGDFWINLQSALISYNRPLIFLVVFTGAFLVLHFFVKSLSFLLKLLIALAIIVVLAVYFVITYASAIRY